MTPQNLLNGEFRSQFQAAVLSTGAFPIGLPARLIERQTSDYQSRAWAFRVDKRRQLDTLRPKWPERADGRSEYPVLYAGSDGGLIDNEPFELAHWTIMKRAGTPNETSAKKADRAVLMIDPFPTPSSFDPDISDEKVKEQLWLRKVIFSLFPVLKDQARFKAIDLARAANAEVYSRFLIAPSRRINVKRNGRADRIEAYEPLATGVLNGFGGFLCRKFPDFDYQLGRRNCQQFLSERLVLDANNPLFKNWPANAKDRKRFCSIIPLLGSAIPEVELPQWPRVGEDLVEEFMAHVKRRVSKLVKKVSREEIGGGLGIVVRVGWWLYRGKVLGWIRSWLVADLIRRDQHERWEFLQDDVDRLIIAALFDPNTDPPTAEAIAGGINRYRHGRAEWRPLTANDVDMRLKGNLAKYVIVSSKGGRKSFEMAPDWRQPRKSG